MYIFIYIYIYICIYTYTYMDPPRVWDGKCIQVKKKNHHHLPSKVMIHVTHMNVTHMNWPILHINESYHTCKWVKITHLNTIMSHLWIQMSVFQLTSIFFRHLNLFFGANNRYSNKQLSHVAQTNESTLQHSIQSRLVYEPEFCFVMWISFLGQTTDTQTSRTNESCLTHGTCMNLSDSCLFPSCKFLFLERH